MTSIPTIEEFKDVTMAQLKGYLYSHPELEHIYLDCKDWYWKSISQLNKDQLCRVATEYDWFTWESNKKYYRVFDLQCGRYMASGYNATSLEQLRDDFISYFSNDHSKETIQAWKKLKTKQEIETWLGNEELELEESDEQFDEDY